jgi:hypothetical protein
MRAVPEMARWRQLAESVDSFTKDVKIAIVGKYTGLQDSYLSVIKVRTFSEPFFSERVSGLPVCVEAGRPHVERCMTGT